MRKQDFIIIASVYACIFLIGINLNCGLYPNHEDFAYAMAAVLGASVGGYLYHRRDRQIAPMRIRLFNGIFLSVLGIGMGFLMAYPRAPETPMPFIIVGTVFISIVSFGLSRKGLIKASVADRDEALSRSRLVLIISVCAITAVASFALPAGPRLTVRRLPGINIALPDWNMMIDEVSEHTGHLMLQDQTSRGRRLDLRWDAFDQSIDQLLPKILADGGTKIDNKITRIISTHDGFTAHLSAPDGSKAAMFSAWYCPETRRVFFLINSVDPSRAEDEELHRRVIDSVQCHVDRGH